MSYRYPSGATDLTGGGPQQPQQQTMQAGGYMQPQQQPQQYAQQQYGNMGVGAPPPSYGAPAPAPYAAASPPGPASAPFPAAFPSQTQTHAPYQPNPYNTQQPNYAQPPPPQANNHYAPPPAPSTAGGYGAAFPTPSPPVSSPYGQAPPPHQPPQQPSYGMPPPPMGGSTPSMPPPPSAGYGAPSVGGAYPPPPLKKADPEYPPQMGGDGPGQMYGSGGYHYPGQAPAAPQQQGGGYQPTLTPGQPGWDPRSAHPLPPPGQPQGAPQHQQQGQTGMHPPQAGGAGYGQQAQQMAPQQQAPPQHLIPPWARLPHPKYMVLTCSAMPNSHALRQRSNVPMGMVLRPLADPPSSASQPLPTINPSQTGVIRCRECRAYINPFVQFLEAGARWRCNLCGLINEVPQAYFSSLDAQGRRLDIDQRPELVHGSVEIIAPVDYMVRQPMPPVYFFVIDVSEASVKSGMLQTLCDAVLAALDKLPGDKRTLVGVITFDSAVHFYSLKPGETSTPQMFVMPDLDDVFLPQPQDLLVNLDESRSQVEQLISSLPAMHAKTKDVEAAVGPALDGALQVMARIGGKLLLFLSGLPSLGAEGRLINRENTRMLGTDKEHVLLSTPSVDFYKKHAIKMTKYQICCDLFLFQNDMNANAAFLDVATLSDLNKLTGGQLYFYPNYYSAQHGAKFHKELTRCLVRTQGWEAVVRVRASKGVRISEFHGNFLLRGTDLMALPGVDSDKAFAFELRNDESILSTPTISIQAALLYTTSSGERRIRVHTTCIPVSSLMGELFDRVNVNAITNLLAKQAVITVLKEGFDKARELIRNRAVALLRTHRTALVKGQAGASNELNVLPLMTLGLLKNAAFKEGTDMRTDMRAFLLASMYTMGIVEMETFVRPRMLPVHDMSGEVGLPKANSKPVPPPTADGAPAPPPPVQSVELPAEAGLTADVLKPDTVFLVDNGLDFLLRVGRGVNPAWLQSVFGVPTLEGRDGRSLQLQPPSPTDTDSPLRRLTNILTYLREVSPLYQQLLIIKEGEANELKFFNMLIEDRNMSAMSLAEFDQFIQRAGAF